ncbi:MAG TPA: RICIN domain-containing protein [Thermoanaerobaculia bacterium]|nr:RICIN domain-containing protein [Thermoanaerobaculia bacterium]
MELPQPVPFYYIQIKDDRGETFCLQPKDPKKEPSQLTLIAANGHSEQQWAFIRTSRLDEYRIVNGYSGYSADAAGDSKDPGNGTKVQQHSWEQQENQHWRVSQTDKGTQLKSAYNDKAWVVEGGKVKVNAKIILNDLSPKSNPNEYFTLVPVS